MINDDNGQQVSGCYICNKNPVVAIIAKRPLCTYHFKIAKICETCGSFFLGNKNQLFCSKECHRDYKPSSFHFIKICEYCNRQFDSTKKQQKYCSKLCQKNKAKQDWKENRKVTSRDRIIIFARDGFQCIYCGRTSYQDKIKLHVEHIIPQDKGGVDTAENLATGCAQCNLGKAVDFLFNINSIYLEVQRRNNYFHIDPDMIIKITDNNEEENPNIIKILNKIRECLINPQDDRLLKILYDETTP